MRLKSPSRFVRVSQGVTVATFKYIDAGWTRRVETKHHPVPQRVYMRRGKKKCKELLALAAAGTASTAKK